MVPSATASPGIVYDDTYYMSAKSAYIPALGVITPDVLLQARLSMRNLLDDLEFAPDMDFSNVVSATAYMSGHPYRRGQLPRCVWKFFKDKRYPALTVLQQTAIRANGGRGNRPAPPLAQRRPIQRCSPFLQGSRFPLSRSDSPGHSWNSHGNVSVTIEGKSRANRR